MTATDFLVAALAAGLLAGFVLRALGLAIRSGGTHR